MTETPGAEPPQGPQGRPPGKTIPPANPAARSHTAKSSLPQVSSARPNPPLSPDQAWPPTPPGERPTSAQQVATFGQDLSGNHPRPVAQPPRVPFAPATPATTAPSYPRPFLISDLCKVLERYLEPAQIALIYEAYLFGAEAHDGQHRRSGEPYIYHPLAVARILAGMRLDHHSIIAAILHDVLEDTSISKETLAAMFGKEVAQLVDGVTKLTKIKFGTRAEAQAANLRKMVLAMARDIRVILIKLADRLHNMRTLGAMPPEKRRRIAHETLEIYAPIANRLGINTIRLELEDLGFSSLYPMRYRVLEAAVKRFRGERKEVVERIEAAVKRRLRQERLDGRVVGRQKHLYSIYRKMRIKHLPFNEVLDIYAFRIVVDRADTCYRVLGAVHNLYKPLPGKFKDYIAIPKSNGYQSLHTTVVGPYGVHVEVQIRTEDMERVAEAGVAAHWLYKVGEGSDNSAQQRAREWLRGLLDMQQRAGDSLEFIENVKIDLFPDEVYVFSPKGKIYELPRGSTPVDFAYAVHTDVGHACVAAKIDRRLVPLRSRLHNGQQVEIITAPGATPNPSWLNFVATAKARSNIRSFLKNLQGEEAVALGRRMLGKALIGHGLALEQLSDALVAAVLAEFQLETMDALLADIGVGNRMVLLVARRFAQGINRDGEPGGATDQAGDRNEGPDQDQGRTSLHKPPLAIRGTEGMVVSFARCCRPIPGDDIVGYLSAGRGIIIHREDCNNISEFKKQPEKWIEVEWAKDTEREFPVGLRVEVANRRGVLATVAAAISDAESNIDNITIEESDGLTSTMHFLLEVHDRSHLARLIRRVRRVPDVMRISRTKS